MALKMQGDYVARVVLLCIWSAIHVTLAFGPSQLHRGSLGHETLSERIFSKGLYFPMLTKMWNMRHSGELHETSAQRKNYEVVAWDVSKELDKSISPGELMEVLLYPESERNSRLKVGNIAQGIHNGNGLLRLDDDRMALTYAEFPMESFRLLITLATHYLPKSNRINMDGSIKRRKLIDLGSGTGKLAVYGALMQFQSDHYSDITYDANLSHEKWDVHGIEISRELHDMANRILDRAVAKGLLLASQGKDSHLDTSSITLHLGSAAICAGHQVFEDADIVFCYSTALPTSGFSVVCEAMVLNSEWSSLLAGACPNGCIVITTDRVLAPEYGWKLLDSISVENPELCGSIGYIQRLDKI